MKIRLIISNRLFVALFPNKKTLTCSYYQIMDIFFYLSSRLLFFSSFTPLSSFSIVSPYFFTPFSQCPHKRIPHSNTSPQLNLNFEILRTIIFLVFQSALLMFFFFHSFCYLVSSINKQSFFLPIFVAQIKFFSSPFSC